MSLDDLYSKHSVADKDKIQNEKNIILLAPNSEYDYSADLIILGLDKKEVICTYPKSKSDAPGLMRGEINAIKPEVIVQLGGFVLSDKLPSIKNGAISDWLKNKIRAAVGDRFVNLHHHDEYSIRDGLGTNKQLIELLKKRRRSFCCVTNHGSLAGWVQQHSNCKKANIKALFGCELYREEYRDDDPEMSKREYTKEEKITKTEEKKKHRSASHLLTIARNEEGFYNLIKIHNDAQLNGFYYSPRTFKPALQKWGKGIISSTTCIIGDIPKCLGKDDYAGAEEWYNFYKSCFDKYYVELPMIEWDYQVEMNKKLIKFAQKVGAPLIVTLDSHYVAKEHSKTHDILMLIRDKKTVHDKARNAEEVWQFETRNLYYRTEQEVRQLWEDGFDQRKEYTENDEVKERFDRVCYKDDIFTKEILDEAIENTRRIAMMCDEMKLDSTLKLPKMYDDGDTILREKAWDKFKKKKLDTKVDSIKYKERLEFELKMITDLGYSDYFLTIDKIVEETVKNFNEFAVNYGRGSAAGSLVAYCLGLTDIDPIEYGLLFERFLDYSRRPVSACSFKV